MTELGSHFSSADLEQSLRMALEHSHTPTGDARTAELLEAIRGVLPTGFFEQPQTWQPSEEDTRLLNECSRFMPRVETHKGNVIQTSHPARVR